MSKPTEEQVKKYEAAHTALFASLVISNNLWLGMPGKFGFNAKDKTSAKYKAWFAMGQKIGATAGKWAGRQYKLEQVKDGNVQKITPYMGYFLQSDPAKQNKLNAIALSLIKPGTAGQGLGFVPLIIWAIVAIALAFTTAYIIDETNTTAQEQADLMKTTSETMKALNIPPDKAATIIATTQEQATANEGVLPGLTGGGLNSLLPLGILFLLFMSLNKKSNNKNN